MAQQGYLFLKHGAWYVRYRDHEGRQQCEHLASKTDYPKKSEVDGLRRGFMERVNRSINVPQSGATVSEFVEQTYDPVPDKNPTTLAKIAGARTLENH